MGYTHYWVQKRDFTTQEWDQICAAVDSVVHEHRNILCYDENQPSRRPQVDGSMIHFNGKGIDGWDTFVLTRKMGRVYSGDSGAFGCCKTARNPYDGAVVEVLREAKRIAPDAIGLSSDGGPEVFGEDDMGDF